MDAPQAPAATVAGPRGEAATSPGRAPRPAGHRQQDPGLRYAATFFAVSAVLHNGDHFRRGVDTVTGELFLVGSLGMVISAGAVYLVLTGHRTAPIVAVAAGFPLAIGFAAAHWLPHWSALSDPFVSGGASGWSIAASLLEIVGALWLGVAGWRAVRRRGLAASAW